MGTEGMSEDRAEGRKEETQVSRIRAFPNWSLGTRKWRDALLHVQDTRKRVPPTYGSR